MPPIHSQKMELAGLVYSVDWANQASPVHLHSSSPVHQERCLQQMPPMARRHHRGCPPCHDGTNPGWLSHPLCHTSASCTPSKCPSIRSPGGRVKVPRLSAAKPSRGKIRKRCGVSQRHTAISDTLACNSSHGALSLRPSRSRSPAASRVATSW